MLMCLLALILAEKLRQRQRLSKRYLHYVPRVESADRKVGVREKVIYSIISLLIYLVCRHLPLYGMPSIKYHYPLHPFNSILPIIISLRGTVMDLAIIPVVLSRLLIQIDFMITEENRALINAGQKLLSMVIGLESSVMYVFYNVDQLGVGNAILVIFQLWFAGIIVIYLDELLQKGYGFGPAISLFTATSICEDIIWKAFHQQNLHYVTNLLATILIFLIVIYLQGFHMLLPLTSRNDSGLQYSYQINFFYAPNTPIILLSASVFPLYIFSQGLRATISGNLFLDLLGKWNKSEYVGGPSIPVGGIAYYITAPSSLADMAANPFHALFHLVFVSSTCALISRIWIEISGSSALDVAIQLKEQEMVVCGNRELFLYIPTAAAFGGMCIGALTVLADLTGAFGSGPGILFVVTFISQYFEAFEKDEETEQVNLAPLGF